MLHRHAVRVSPQFSNRMVDASRSILNRYIPDLYIHSDVYKGEDSGKSPGYALSLLAETTEGALYCSEAVSTPRPDPHSAKERSKAKKDRMFQDEEKDDGLVPITPEDIALTASRELLVAIRQGGCVDRKHQWLVLLYMVLGSEDVGRVRMGQLSARRLVLRFIHFSGYKPTFTQCPVFARREGSLRDFVQDIRGR